MDFYEDLGRVRDLGDGDAVEGYGCVAVDMGFFHEGGHVDIFLRRCKGMLSQLRCEIVAIFMPKRNIDKYLVGTLLRKKSYQGADTFYKDE